MYSALLFIYLFFLDYEGSGVLTFVCCVKVVAVFCINCVIGTKGSWIFSSSVPVFCCGYNLVDGCTCKKILTMYNSGSRVQYVPELEYVP